LCQTADGFVQVDLCVLDFVIAIIPPVTYEVSFFLFLAKPFQTARIGLVSYLSFIAFISISLGVMNLLPIPVLDGGHLLYYSLEVLTGRPLPERVGEIAQRLGIGLLLTLMVLAVFNDVLRLLN